LQQHAATYSATQMAKGTRQGTKDHRVGCVRATTTKKTILSLSGGINDRPPSTQVLIE